MIFLSVGLAQGGVLHLLIAYRGRSAGIAALVNQFTGALGAWLALPPVVFIVANAALRRSHWLRLLWLHLAGYVAFTALHVLAIRVLRWPLWAVFHVLPNNDGPLYSRVLWEAQNDLLVYCGAAALLTLLRVWQERQTSELRAAQLEAQLARAQLDVLSARLDPHFLYNALNTVNAVMHEDLARTERL
ncbi:MAG TPA: histidine kinase, partial [Polyangiaceae bacterium]